MVKLFKTYLEWSLSEGATVFFSIHFQHSFKQENLLSYFFKNWLSYSITYGFVKKLNIKLILWPFQVRFEVIRRRFLTLWKIVSRKFSWTFALVKEFNPISVGLIFDDFLWGGALDAPPPLKSALIEPEKFFKIILESSQKWGRGGGGI